MTTSQASRVFAIPYNSLLMYVRGKYGKSLKLDLLKAQTPAATDNLNTIGNSRSTPKEKAHFNEGKSKAAKAPAPMPNAMLPSPGGGGPGGLPMPPALPVMPPQSSQPVSLPPHPTGGPLGLNPFAAFQSSLPHLQDQMGGLLGHDASRIRDLMLNLQREQHPMLAAAAAAAAAASSQQNRSPASTPTRPDMPARPGSATPDGGGTPEKVTSSVAAVAQFAAAVQQHQQQLQQMRGGQREEGAEEDHDENDDVFDDDMPEAADIERNEDVAMGGEVAEVTKEVGSEDKEKASSDNNAGVMTGSSGEEEQMEEEDMEEPTPAPAENTNAFQGLPEISA